VSKRGFQLETHSTLGFGSETICPSRGISDSAVKLSALAVELEKPFRFFICRELALWFEDLQCGRHFICRFEEVRAFLFGTS
jgi:hypothetical protein